jgi:hypothetical protein
MTEQSLDPIIKTGQIALKDPNATLATVAAALVEVMPEVEQLAPAIPQPPKPLVLTDEVLEALKQVPEVFAAVQPEDRRALTETEIAALYMEREMLREVTTVLDGRDESIKEYIRIHLDVEAEAAGKANGDTKTDLHGHYILASKGNPERVPISGSNKKWSREYFSRGGAVDGSRLLGMYEAGEISREDYLAFTRETRVFDEDKALKSIHDDPTRLTILARLAVPGTEGSSVTVR